jgi:hypothetical protein
MSISTQIIHLPIQILIEGLYVSVTVLGTENSWMVSPKVYSLFKMADNKLLNHYKAQLSAMEGRDRMLP